MSAPEKRVREVLAAATPGPWVPQSRDDGSTFPWYVDTHAYPDGPEPVWAPPQYPVSRQDVVAIVVARNLLPVALDVIEAARALLVGAGDDDDVPPDDEWDPVFLTLRDALDHWDREVATVTGDEP